MCKCADTPLSNMDNTIETSQHNFMYVVNTSITAECASELQ